MRLHIGFSFNLKKLFKYFIPILVGIITFLGLNYFDFSIFKPIKVHAEEITENDTINNYVYNYSTDYDSNIDFANNYIFFGNHSTTLEILHNIYILNLFTSLFFIIDKIVSLIKRRR